MPIKIAPTKVLIVPISNQPQFKPIVRKLAASLRSLGIANNVDSSGASLGKRYARNDELGTPLAITIDHTTLLDGSITLRERDTTKQVRDSEDGVVQAVQNMVNGSETWATVSERLPTFTAGNLED